MPIPRLAVFEEWVDSAEEAALLTAVDASPWRGDLKRRVQHYGWRYDYAARRVDRSMYLGPLPAWAARLAETIAAEGRSERVPDQVIVNEYEPGQGIASHVDCRACFGPTILSLSLGSAVVLDMRGPCEEKEQVALPRRSLLRLAGEARSTWAHGIAPRRSDVLGGQRVARGRRVSLTFRCVLSS